MQEKGWSYTDYEKIVILTQVTDNFSISKHKIVFTWVDIAYLDHTMLVYSSMLFVYFPLGS